MNSKRMEELVTIPSVSKHKILQLNQGIFYSLNETGKRLPVNRIMEIEVLNNHTLLFYSNYFPITEKAWNIFAAELYLFKKGIPYSMDLKGIGIIADAQLGLVEFQIQDVLYFEHPKGEKRSLLYTLFQPYNYIYKKSFEIIHKTGHKKVAI